MSLTGREDSSLADIDRARGGFDDHQSRINGRIGKASQRANACLEVGDDDGVGSWNGAEQLLSGQATSRSIRLRVVDPVDDRQADPVGSVGSVCVEDVVPRVGVGLAAFVNLVAE